jgi:precorrin-6x reductase
VILVLGGTAESVPIAQALLEAGFQVLLSTATSRDFDFLPGPAWLP